MSEIRGTGKQIVSQFPFYKMQKKKKTQGSMLTQNGAEIYTIIKVENYTFIAVPCIAVK